MAWIEAVAAGGAGGALVREPGADRRAVEAAVARADELGLAVAVHDRCPEGRAIAAAFGAPVHLPAGAPFPRGPFAVSCHGGAEVDAALGAGAVYVTLSPVWRPSSKPGDRRPPLGPARFLAIGRGRPVLALGGVTPARFGALVARGAYGAAVLGPLRGPPEAVARAVGRFVGAR